MYTRPLEATVVHAILTQLSNLGWTVDEKSKGCNVTQQRPKTEEEKKKLGGKRPDFVLYQQDTNIPIAIIEAKRPNESLSKAIKQAEELYARPLETPLIFAYNDTYIETKHIYTGRALKVDGEDVRQFVDHYTSLRFIEEGPEILSAPEHVQYSREQLITIFKRAANLLREAGLQAGLERFGAFSDILFLKIMDEICEIRLHAGQPSPIEDHLRWKNFQDKTAPQLHKYMKSVVWKQMNDLYGDIFSDALPIESPEILKDIIGELSELNLTAAKTDVKGDAFEYFLKNAYQGLSIKDLGEYFTPRNIVRTMVSMANPMFGEKIYDPFCGTGGFLIEVFKYLQVRTKLTKRIEKTLKEETVYGSELTTNARICKMNMILFGDGHANIVREDSFANPKSGKFDVVLTNIPYSQKTRYGNQYPTCPRNGDAVAVLHCFESLNAGGRAAILIKEDFLSKGGDIGRAREYIFRGAKNFSVVSLPRKLFVPYTPTKTSIIYFEKSGERASTFFYVVKKVGHTLATRKKSIKENDLPIAMDAFNSQEPAVDIDSCVVDNQVIEQRENSLWVYDYLEVVPDSRHKLDYLGKYIEPVSNLVSPSDNPDDDFLILGVNNRQGIYENEILLGSDIKQKYHRATAGEISYNPHRVNVGSIGLVAKEYEGGYLPSIYVVFRATKPKVVPAEYILALLKSKIYKKVIEAYDTKYGAVRANLTYGQLCRIKIPLLDDESMKEFLQKQKEISRMRKQVRKREAGVMESISYIASEKVSPKKIGATDKSRELMGN